MDAPLDVAELSWDEWNLEHTAKHGVSIAEVAEVVFGDAVARQTYKNRLQVIGPTRDGRMLTIIVGPVPRRSRVYDPFSARPASRQERRYYADRKGWSRDER